MPATAPLPAAVPGDAAVETTTSAEAEPVAGEAAVCPICHEAYVDGEECTVLPCHAGKLMGVDGCD